MYNLRHVYLFMYVRTVCTYYVNIKLERMDMHGHTVTMLGFCHNNVTYYMYVCMYIYLHVLRKR